MLHSIQFNSI